MDDQDLLHRYVSEGSEPAFRELMRRHLALVHAAALRQTRGDTHLAQDVAQRVFIALARKAAEVSRQRTVVGWLYIAARLEAARIIRTESRRRRREEGAADMNPIPASEIPAEPLRAVLDEAMAELGEEDRAAVLLRYFSGQSFAAIGRGLQLSEDAARKRVERALEKLGENLGRRGVASTASVLAGALHLHAAPALSPALTATIEAGVWQQLATGTATSLTALMTSTKAMVIAAGVLGVAGGIVLHERAALHDASAATASAETALAQVNGRQATLARELESVRHQIAATETTAPAMAGPRPAAPATAYYSDPEYRRLNRQSQQARHHLEFQRLYRELKLTPDQEERFEAIMVRQDEAQLDAASVRAAGGDEQTVYQRSGAEWSSAMTALLGDEGFKQLQDYLRGMPVRAFIDNYAVQSAAVGAALTTDQADQLAALALANDVMYRQGRGTDPGTVGWAAVWDPAAKLLNGDQLALLQRTVEVWALQKQIQLRLKSPSGQ